MVGKLWEGGKWMDQETFDRIKEEAIGEVLRNHFKGSLKTQEKVALHRLLEKFLEEIMKEERKIFLEKSPNNKRNEYDSRSLSACLPVGRPDLLN